MKTVSTSVINATTSNSVTLSNTGISLIVLPVSTGVACQLTLTKKVIFERTMKIYKIYKDLSERKHQTIYTFGELFRNS